MLNFVLALATAATAGASVSMTRVNVNGANVVNDTRLHCTGSCQSGYPSDMKMNRVMPLIAAESRKCHREKTCPDNQPRISGAKVACVDGKAGEYPCKDVDLLSYVSISDMGGRDNGNDIWGWTKNGREFALVALTDGSSFVDITDAENPKVCGFLPTHTSTSTWRDIKVDQDHAFIISEASNHGMQVFDLTRLLEDGCLDTATRRYEADKHYGEFGNCHNIVINEDSHRAYGVGTRTCRGGPHIMDLTDPKDPKYMGCFESDGYTHDAECITYDGPDSEHQGKEICFLYNEDTLTVADLSDPQNPVQLSRTAYTNNRYTHQGWLTEDRKYILLDDELDEMYATNEQDKYTRTLIWNMEDLDKPEWIGVFTSSQQAVDHNMYIKGNYAYQANYVAGLRVLDLSGLDPTNPVVTEAAYFKVDPNRNGVTFNGAWSVYPYFPSGNIVVNSIERGLYVLKVNV